MSTDFSLSKKVSARDLFGGQLEKFGVRELIGPETNERIRALSDGCDCLMVYLTDDGFVSFLSRNGPNTPDKILVAIAETFETEIFSEHQPQFWGFNTQEEWDAGIKELHDRHQREFYAVEQDAARLQPENKDRLEEIRAFYEDLVREASAKARRATRKMTFRKRDRSHKALDFKNVEVRDE
jgi:hypothetical protein